MAIMQKLKSYKSLLMDRPSKFKVQHLVVVVTTTIFPEKTNPGTYISGGSWGILNHMIND